MALVTRYKTLVDIPGAPAGQILAKQTGEHAYQSETQAGFWMSETVVENDPNSYQFISVTDNSGIVTAIKTTVRSISKTDFLNRLTNTELATIMTAASQNIAVAVWKQRFDSHDGLVNLDDAELVAGLQSFEAAGLLAAGRAAAIVS